MLEPFDELERLGFEVALPVCGEYVTADSVFGALRPDTLLVSVMQVNNETGIRQPLDAVCEALIGQRSCTLTRPRLWQGPPAAANLVRTPVSISGQILRPKVSASDHKARQ